MKEKLIWDFYLLRTETVFICKIEFETVVFKQFLLQSTLLQTSIKSHLHQVPVFGFIYHFYAVKNVYFKSLLFFCENMMYLIKPTHNKTGFSKIQ